MPTRAELEKAFSVYLDEIERGRKNDCYWALLHVVVALPDICGALDSATGWATPEKYVAWCANYCPTGDILTAEDYRDIRNVVLHQGRTVTTAGRVYKFTRPTASGGRLHRCSFDGGATVVLDVGELANDMIAGIRVWCEDLQTPGATERRAYVAQHLPKLVMVQDQELPGISGPTFSVTQTCTTGIVFRRMPGDGPEGGQR